MSYAGSRTEHLRSLTMFSYSPVLLLLLLLLQVSKGSQYPELLKALIVQSMIKIEEDAITVICREADIEAVKSVVGVSTVVSQQA